MLLWNATEIVTCIIRRVFLLWTIVHLTYQVTESYLDKHDSVLTLNIDFDSSLYRLFYSYSHTSVWIHNRYILEYWRAKKETVHSRCNVNSEDISYAKRDHSHYIDRGKTDLRKSKTNQSFDTGASEELSTSVWCYSSSESGLRCHFQYLHYNPVQKEYVFVHSSKSVIYGIDNIKNLQEKLFLSSVIDHNAFPFQVTVVPHDIFISSYSSKLVNGRSFFMARFKPDNLQHVFHDDLIPLYFTMRELCGKIDTCVNELMLVFTEGSERNLYWELYRVLARKIILLSELESVGNQSWYCFESAYFGVNKLSMWYQYGFGKPQGPQVTRTFSGHLLRQFIDFMKEKLQVKPADSSKQTIVVISRKHNRKILNEEELSVLIRNHLKTRENEEHEVRVMSLEENGITEMISELTRARLAVGVHGAGLILGIFLPPSSVLVEIWPYGINPNAATVYKSMCNLRDFRVSYIPWVNEDAVNTVIHLEYPPHLGGLGHLTSKEKEHVLRGLHERKIEKLVCCDNAEWLFRIYQDTTVLLLDENAKYKSVPFVDVLNRVSKAWDEESIQTNTRDGSLMLQLYPSQVQEFTWSLIKDSHFKTLVLEWKDSWNIQNLNCDRTWFEVVLHAEGDNEAQRYYISTTRYEKELQLEVEAVSVWITCFCGDTEGSVFYARCNML